MNVTPPMDALEMLDALEGRIAAMRDERVRLASLLEDAERRLKTISDAAQSLKDSRRPAKSRAAKSRAAKSRAQKTRGGKPARKRTGTEKLPAPAMAEPSLGKRRALGRSLAEIRGLRRGQPTG